MKKSPKGKGGSKSKETPIEETTPKEINDIIRLSVHSLNAGKVIEFPFDVKIKLMFAGELVGETDLFKVENENDIILDSKFIYGTELTSFVLYQKLLNNPFFFTVIVLNMSTSTVASKKGSEKSKGTAASKGKIKNGEVLLGSATLDIFPILLGNAEIKFRLLLEKDEFVEGSHVISWPNLPSLCVSAAVVGDILMKDEARPFNVLYITLESLYNFPASVTNLSVALMFPLFENENYETIRFEDCQFKETPYGDQKKRWATLSKITGRSALSSYMLSDNSVEILNEAKVDKQLLNNLSNYPRLEWNAIHRCWMLQSSQEMIIERLTKYRCWPLELYINEDVGKISKTKEKNVKDANITMSKVHFVAYLNLTKLLYPGVEEVHVTSQLYTYVKKDMITTSGQEKSVFDTSEPVPDETPATATAPVAAKPPKPSKVPTKKKPKSDVEEKIEDEISLPIFTEDGEPVFVTVQVQVMKPFFQKRTPDYLENSILELIPKRPEPNTALVNSEKAVKDLTDCLEILSSLLDRNYQEFSKTYNCQNQENIKKDFVAYIEDSGIGTTIMNTLRDKVVNYIKFKIGLPQKIEYHLPFQNFLCDTYTKIVEHMYKTVNSLTDGHLTAERASLDPLPLQVKTTDLYYFALEALEEGFFKRAKIYLLKRLNFDKGNSGFWLDLAIFMLGNGDVSSSIEYVKEVIILETRDKLGLLLYGILLFMKEEYTEAELFFNAVTTFYPDFIEGWITFHLFYVHLQRPEASDATYMIAKKREQYGPTSWPGNEQEKSLLSWCPDVISQSPSLYLMTAVLLLRFNCFMFAEMCFAKELELSKDHQNNNQTEVSILYYMAVCDYKQERFQQAISHLDNALHINWQIPQLHCLKGYCYYKLFEFDSSLESLNIVIHSENVQIDVHLTYLRGAIININKGVYKEAKDILILACKYFPTPLTWLNLGIACYKLENYEDAESALNEANILDCELEMIWAYLALVNLKLNRPNFYLDCYYQAVRFGLDNKEVIEEINSLKQLVIKEDI